MIFYPEALQDVLTQEIMHQAKLCDLRLLSSDLDDGRRGLAFEGDLALLSNSKSLFLFSGVLRDSVSIALSTFDPPSSPIAGMN